MAVTLSVRSSRLLCFFMLKYFRRMSTLQAFFNTKVFPTKISYNENFRYIEIIQLYVLIVFNLVVHSNLPNLKPLPTFLDIDYTTLLTSFQPHSFSTSNSKFHRRCFNCVYMRGRGVKGAV